MEITFRCSHPQCIAERVRGQTKSEAERIEKDFRKDNEESKKMHRAWHDFCNKFRDKNGDWKPYKSNWNRMVAVERWAKKYPKDVIVLGCDDDVHSSSNIVLVMHRIKRRLWGTSVVVLTQCDGRPPKVFFLYPGHVHELALALRKLIHHAPYWGDSYEKAENKKSRKLWR